MNTETYDQIALSADQVGDSLKFVKENEMVKLCSHDGNVFAIEPPISVELEVTETEPGIKRVTQQQVLLSQLSLRQELRLWFHYSLTRAIRLRLILVQVSTHQEHNQYVLLKGCHAYA